MLWGIPLVVPEEQGVLEAIVHPSKEQQEAPVAGNDIEPAIGIQVAEGHTVPPALM